MFPMLGHVRQEAIILLGMIMVLQQYEIDLTLKCMVMPKDMDKNKFHVYVMLKDQAVYYMILFI